MKGTRECFLFALSLASWEGCGLKVLGLPVQPAKPLQFSGLLWAPFLPAIAHGRQAAWPPAFRADSQHALSRKCPSEQACRQLLGWLSLAMRQGRGSRKWTHSLPHWGSRYMLTFSMPCSPKSFLHWLWVWGKWRELYMGGRCVEIACKQENCRISATGETASAGAIRCCC